ncbi:PipX family protein [Oscillatoria sp. CS-180]|uniref:transcriptional coactivator PipX n=1 Tax=Oscillatoria sp. CS-180 TaxID=3021720 RepID=UPI00232B8DC0|nr:PipX family protein [Oscillatoria sp. CS-180]MDB9528808.1 PipX family protein [Oscillatoria sp. CS-180]
MSTENYINHPTFGLLFRLCLLDEGTELFATLYAQRLFFIVSPAIPKGLAFEAIGRGDARQMVEERMRHLRRRGDYSEYDRLQKIYKKTFQ